MSAHVRLIFSVLLTLWTAAPALAVEKVASQGMSYTVDKQPAWVRDTATPSMVPTQKSPWYYSLVDDQILLEGNKQSMYVRVVRTLADAKGLGDIGQISMYFNPEYQTLTIHDISVVRAGRRINQLDRKNIRLLQREEQLEKRMYDGMVTASVVIPDLRVGDSIDYRYTVTGANPVFEGRFVHNFWISRNPVPRSLQLLRITAAATRDIRYRSFDPGVTVNRQVTGATQELTIKLVDGGVPDVLPDLPPREWLKQMVQFSEFKDWQDVAAWGQRLFARAQQPSASLTRQVEQWRRDGSAPKDQARSALDFAQKEIRYFGVELGEYSHLPTAPEKVLAQRHGDCKDKSLLLSQGLQQLGIKSWPVLVASSWRGEVKDMLPSPLAFDHAITGFELDGQTWWVDPTKSFEGGPLTGRQARQFGYGLPVASGTTDLVAAPARLNNDPVVQYNDLYEVKAFNQPVQLTATIVYSGDLAEQMISLWQQPAQRAVLEKELSAEYTRRQPNIRLIQGVAMTELPDRNAVRFVIRFEIPDLFEYTDKKWLVSSAFAWGPLGDLRPGLDATRRVPLWLGMPRAVEHVVQFRLPEEVLSQPYEKAQSVEDEAFALSTQLTSDKQNFRFRVLLETTKNTVPTERWSDFNKHARQAATALYTPVGFPVLAPARQTALGQDVSALARDFREGKIKVLTEVQGEAMTNRLLYQAQLNSGRLTTEQQAKVYLELAMAQNNLGQQSDALASGRKAVTLALPSADANSEFAEILWGQGKFQESLDVLDKIAPSSQDAKFWNRRGRSLFALGSYGPAVQALTQAVDKASGDSKWYSVAWLYLATQRAGGDAKAVLDRNMPGANDTSLIHELIRFMAGTRSELDVLQKTKSSNNGTELSRRCEALFFMGMQALARNDATTAKRYLEMSRDTGVTEYIEQRAARFELSRLDRPGT